MPALSVKPYRIGIVKESTYDGTIKGVCDGVNKTFTLSYIPMGLAALQIFVNRDFWGDNHYTLVGNTFTTDVPPVKGATIWACYTMQTSS